MALQAKRRPRPPQRIWGIAVGVLALVGIGASAAHFLQEPYNPGFLRYPAIVGVHVVLGAVYLALAPFQFLGRIRVRYTGYHRRMGRVLIGLGLIVGATALFIGLVIPFSGWAERVVIGTFGSLFVFALSRGFVSIRAGRVAAHRAWMTRAFAIGLSVATMRLIFVPALMFGSPSERQIELLSVVSFTVAFMLHAALTELWLYTSRRSVGAETPAPTPPALAKKPANAGP